MRTLCAAALVAAPVALTATPAQALTSCTVNGRPVSGTTVSGTAGPDHISCGALALGDTVDGSGGSDYIVINGTVAGGAGNDSITANAGLRCFRAGVTSPRTTGAARGPLIYFPMRRSTAEEASAHAAVVAESMGRTASMHSRTGSGR
ncbi:hypothetical protein [Streptomyces sp. NPDC057636]|uniref:hypothetical protein n=1 Tax=Streptomyces sp. NPDC057636 TaxID=3346189 RepID=UPI0036887AE7